MQYVIDNSDKIGWILLLVICIFFLFTLGSKLYSGRIDGFFPWAGVIFLTVTGFNMLEEKNPIGFLGFIPIITYIILTVIDSFGVTSTTQKKLQGIIISGVASAATYVITHVFFGFGASEASLSAVIAAGILGTIGYNS